MFLTGFPTLAALPCASQLDRFTSDLNLLNSRTLGKNLHGFAILVAGFKIHVLVYACRIPAQDLFNMALPLKNFTPIQQRELAKAGDSRAFELAKAFPGLKGMDLAKEVSVSQQYEWNQGRWAMGSGYQPAGK